MRGWNAFSKALGSLRFIRQHTDIPVPIVYCDFEEDGAYYLITEYIKGAGMSKYSQRV